MASFEELGTGLFIMVLVINLFLAGFGGVETPKTLEKFIPDGNITDQTVLNPQYNIQTGAYAIPTSTQFTANNDPFGATVSLITQDAYSIIQTVLFGITIFAINIGAPQAILIAIIAPINIIFILYLAEYIVNKSPLRGLFGAWASKETPAQ